MYFTNLGQLTKIYTTGVKSLGYKTEHQPIIMITNVFFTKF